MNSKRFFFSLVLLALCGCGGNNADLTKRLAEISKRKGRPIEPIPKYVPMPKYNYPVDAKRRDPFLPTEIKNGKQANTEAVGKPDLKRPKQVLEQFPLEEIKMVGSLKQNGTIWGLVLAPGGLVHQVTIGTYMGKNYGRVIRVTEEYIRLIETIRDAGKWKKKTLKIELQSQKHQLEQK